MRNGNGTTGLPLVRSHERIDYKRCPKKWYWKWRLGLVKKVVSMGALELGTWMHGALEAWYGIGFKRVGRLTEWFNNFADDAITYANDQNAPDHVIEQAEEIAELGVIMAKAYQDHYGDDEEIDVIGAEIPLAFNIADANGKVIAAHLLKPDMVFRYRGVDGVWLMENKTAKQISVGHLAMDDQARPYGVMSERALKRAGIIRPHETVKGILYNFLRKAIPDERPVNEKGQSLNKNGTVSARQPKPVFVRKQVTLTRAAKLVSLRRIQSETILITELTKRLRSKEIDPANLPKTPHKSCERFCDYFDMCVAEENGIDIKPMQRMMFTRQDPYDYAESTDEPIGFEMG